MDKCCLVIPDENFKLIYIVLTLLFPTLNIGGVFLFLQSGQWFSRCYTESLGHRDGPVFTCSDGPRSCSSMRSVWWQKGCKWCIWLYGQSVGSRDRDLSAHAARAYQQSLFITGKRFSSAAYMNTVHFSSFINLWKPAAELHRPKNTGASVIFPFSIFSSLFYVGLI